MAENQELAAEVRYHLEALTENRGSLQTQYNAL